MIATKTATMSKDKQHASNLNLCGLTLCNAIVVDVITSFVTNLTIRIVGTSFVNKPLNIGQSFNRYCFLETMPNKNVDRERKLEVNIYMPLIWHFMVLPLVPL